MKNQELMNNDVTTKNSPIENFTQIPDEETIPVENLLQETEVYMILVIN